MWTLAWAVIAKDLRVELRSRELLYAMGLFVVLILLIFTFAFYGDDQAAAGVTPGIPWVAITFAGTLGLSRSFSREEEDGGLTGLLLAPIPRGVLYLSKLTSNLLVLLGMEALLLPLCVVMFPFPWQEQPLLLLGLFFAGTLGFSGLGTLFSAVVVRARQRDALLPLLLYPLLVPVLIGGVKGTAAIGLGEIESARSWLQAVLAFDALFLTVSAWAFGWVMGD